MHALAYGVPVISHDDFDQQMPEFEAIVPGKTGDFFAHDDVDSLADTIVRFLRSPISSEMRHAEARRIIDEFYNPRRQRELVDEAIAGERARDHASDLLPSCPKTRSWSPSIIQRSRVSCRLMAEEKG
jgi:hypothetical protein